MRYLSVCTLLFSLILALASCGGGGEVLNFKPAVVTLTAEGPLFEGSNTAQGILMRDALDEVLAQSGHAGAQIASARVTAVRILADSDAATLENISAITLQLAAPGVDMQQVAVLNPVPEGQSSVTLQVAAEQEKIGKLLQQPALTLVADVNLRADTDDNLTLRCELEFEIKVKR